MKSTSSMFRILSIAVLCAVALYFGIQIYTYLNDPLANTVVYPAQAEDSVQADGMIIRDEENFHLGSGILVHQLREGERVGTNQVIATAYNSAGALDTVKAIEEKELQLEQLEFALHSYLDPDAALKLDGAINDSLLTLRSDVADGNYTTASENISNLKGNILKRSHSYSSGTEIQKEITSVQKEIRKLKGSLSDATVVKAERSGTYSAVCDGYESVLTPDFLEGLLPSKLKSVRPGNDEGDVGKLVYGDTWYYAANLSEEEAALFHKGDSVTLRFAKGLELDAPARVYSISPAENGQCTVVWSSTAYMSQVAQLRSIQAEVIRHSYHGLRVPATALRLDENQKGQGGVYCLVGMKARFKPVDVVYNGDGYTLVRASEDATGSDVLRAGDEVIVTASELYDGKVVRESTN